MENCLLLKFKYSLKKELYKDGLIPDTYRKSISIALDDTYKNISKKVSLKTFLKKCEAHRLYKKVPGIILKDFKQMASDMKNCYEPPVTPPEGFLCV